MSMEAGSRVQSPGHEQHDQPPPTTSQPSPSSPLTTDPSFPSSLTSSPPTTDLSSLTSSPPATDPGSLPSSPPATDPGSLPSSGSDTPTAPDPGSLPSSGSDSPSSSGPDSPPAADVVSPPTSSEPGSPKAAGPGSPQAAGKGSPAVASPQCRILVSGYPNYTQPQDLLDVFSKFGEVKIDKCNSWSSRLTFSSAEGAAAALGAGRRAHVWGRALAVRAYLARAAHHARRPVPPGHAPAPAPAATPKRDFPMMNKQKGVIIDPKKIDLSGDFHSQIDNIMAAVRLTQEDVKVLSQLYSDLEAALQSLWPGCKAVPFGSITTGLGIKTSDADCFVNIPAQHRKPNSNFVNKARRVLAQYPSVFAELLAIPRANTPIVKLFHIPSSTSCDLSFKTPLGSQNSTLIAFLLQSDIRLLPMAVLIKYWAKVHELSGTGKLTNYALTMMIIFYLQQPPVSLLPPVASLQQDPAHDYIVDYWNTGFKRDLNLFPPMTEKLTVSELLGGFFEYYAMFNYEEMVICPYLGVPIKKDLFKDTANLPNEFERYKSNVTNNIVMPIRHQSPICVQDPFEQCHNVASTVTSKLALDIKTFFKFAANSYEKEKLNMCREFLKTILLQRPKLIRGKSHPEYRINLFPRLVNTIISLDWKSVIRDLVMEIFENMLKIKLDKVEEKVNTDTRKEKEKYNGVVTKAVWKRRIISKMCNITNMTFEEKQEMITQEVLKNETKEITIQFQLTLTYCFDPKSAVVSIRLSAGDLDSFREFGKFFISVMQSWITELIKPHSMPNCKDTATKIAETREKDSNDINADTDGDDEDEILILPKSNHGIEKSVTNSIKQELSNNNEETLTADSVETAQKKV